MQDKELINELNKILTLEHGHLGMYKDYGDFKDKNISRTFKRFMEIEIEHINRLKSIVVNTGGKPSVLIESGDILGRMLGVTVNLSGTENVIKTYRFIEEKSYQGYSDFIDKLQRENEKRSEMIAEFIWANMIEAQLMFLWHDATLKEMEILV